MSLTFIRYNAKTDQTNLITSEYKEYINACPEDKQNNTNNSVNNSTELNFLIKNCPALNQFKNKNYYQDMLQKLSTLKIALTDDSGKLTGGADSFQTIDCFTKIPEKIYTIAYSADYDRAKKCEEKYMDCYPNKPL